MNWNKNKGFGPDPCVEDQFWLVVHYTHHRGSNKNWWDFSVGRKAYREQYGYPARKAGYCLA